MLKRLKNIDFLGLVLWFIRASIIAVVIWGSVATIIQNPYTTRNWIDFIVFGIAQGSMYALIAIGYSLVYGVLFMINFAHGEFFMSGILTATVLIAGPLSASGFLDEQPVWGLIY